MKLADIWPVPSIRNVREAAPVALLPKQVYQEIGGAGRSKQQKQRAPVKLSGTPFTTAARTLPTRKAVVDEVIGNEWGEQIEEPDAPRHRQNHVRSVPKNPRTTTLQSFDSIFWTQVSENQIVTAHFVTPSIAVDNLELDLRSLW